MAFMVDVAKVTLGVILARTLLDMFDVRGMFDYLKKFLRKKEQ